MTAVLDPAPLDVLTLLEEVWESFVGADEPLLPRSLTPGHPETRHHAPEAGAWWSASITITGTWSGTVTIELPATAAEAVTRRMLAVDLAGPDDVADAIGELVNMVGGNIKAALPDPTSLSLPVVAAGRVAHPSDTVEVCRVEAVWADRPVRVLVHAHHSTGRDHA